MNETFKFIEGTDSIRPYVRKVVNNGQGQEIWLDDPPEMTQRKNWRLLDGTSLSRDGSTRLGLFRDLEAIELKFYSI